ncbi:MAG: hypothetical protein ABIR47_04000, partial [Candidatus Kapaibacterium sp.]
MASPLRRPQFSPKKAYHFGTLVKSSDRSNPEWVTRPLVQHGSFFLKDKCRTIQTWCEKNPHGMDPKKPLAFYEEQEDGRLEYMGSGTPQVPPTAMEGGGLADGLSPFPPHYYPSAPAASNQIPAYVQDQMEFLQRRIESSDSTITQLLQAMEAKNLEVLAAHKEQMALFTQLQIERVKTETQAKAEEEMEKMIERREKQVAKEGGGLGDPAQWLNLIMTGVSMLSGGGFGGGKAGPITPALPF